MWHKGAVMELTTKSTQYDNAIQFLEDNMKKKSSSLPSILRKSLIHLLQKHSDLVTVKGKKIIIPTQFYPVWIKEHKLNSEKKEIDTAHYKFFRKLRKYGYIHPKSSYFPKKLTVITLNPTLPSLYKGNLAEISQYAMAKNPLYNKKIGKMNLTKILSLAYIDLRLFQNVKLTEHEITGICTENIIFISKSIAYLYLEEKGIFDNITIPPYQLIRVEGKLVKILKKLHRKGVPFPFENTDFSKQLSEFRKKFFEDMNMHDIKMASQNNILINSTPLQTTLLTKRAIMSQTTIAEIASLYPAAVPNHLLNIEETRIKNALNRTKDLDEEDTPIDPSFCLEEFEYFDELLQSKNSSTFMKKRDPAKRELLQYIESPISKPHGILIAKYIVHLIESINGSKEERKIAISTFRNYYSILKKHLFKNVEDLSSVQTHEIHEILQNLAINRYKDKSIIKVRNLITDFFKFNNKSHNMSVQINLASYPKSLVFEDEIDLLFQHINTLYVDEEHNERFYKMLRDKTIILFARYTGLRKSELRSRLLQDVYIYGDELCIDVNSEGLKKLDLQLKTNSAKRRVCTQIINSKHLQIIQDYYKLRTNVKTKNKFFFLQNYKKKPEVVKESVFHDLSQVIQKATKRYTSFHSLRHTFATYSVRDILLCNKTNPYKMVDLAVKMGHTSPDITLKKYVHRSVIESSLSFSKIKGGTK